MDREKVQMLIAKQCDELKEMLLEKNRKYGNSVLEPINIMSKATPLEGCLTRIDDKLKRLSNMGVGTQPDEDTVLDLIGYLIIYRVGKELGLG